MRGRRRDRDNNGPCKCKDCPALLRLRELEAGIQRLMSVPTQSPPTVRRIVTPNGSWPRD